MRSILLASILSLAAACASGVHPAAPAPATGGKPPTVMTRSLVTVDDAHLDAVVLSGDAPRPGESASALALRRAFAAHYRAYVTAAALDTAAEVRLRSVLGKAQVRYQAGLAQTSQMSLAAQGAGKSAHPTEALADAYRADIHAALTGALTAAQLAMLDDYLDVEALVASPFESR